MKREFTLTWNGRDYPITADGATVVVNGRPFTVEVSDDGQVLVDGIAYAVMLEGETATVDGKSYAVRAGGLAAADPAPVAVRAGPPSAPVAGGAGSVRAIMPGKIIRVHVETGAQVAEGQPLCVLEAMKMENELRAPRAGLVQAVYIKPGDDVEKDQVLVEIE